MVYCGIIRIMIMLRLAARIGRFMEGPITLTAINLAIFDAVNQAFGASSRNLCIGVIFDYVVDSFRHP
jgi:hypothetical protein